MSLSDLRKLNSVFKKEYIKMVMEEDDTMRNYIKQTNRKLDLTETEVADLKAGIGDTNNTWDQA